MTRSCSSAAFAALLVAVAWPLNPASAADPPKNEYARLVLEAQDQFKFQGTEYLQKTLLEAKPEDGGAGIIGQSRQSDAWKKEFGDRHSVQIGGATVGPEIVVLATPDEAEQFWKLTVERAEKETRNIMPKITPFDVGGMKGYYLYVEKHEFREIYWKRDRVVCRVVVALAFDRELSEQKVAGVRKTADQLVRDITSFIDSRLPKFDEGDYWKWFPKFGDLCEGFEQELEADLKALRLMASHRAMLYRQFQSLLQAEKLPEGSATHEFFLQFFIFNERRLPRLDPVLNLAAVKREKDRITADIAKLREAQTQTIRTREHKVREVVAGAQRQQDRIKAGRQVGLSDEVKKKHEESLGYWKDRQALLRVQMYDAAQWYRPDELPKAIEDLRLTTEASVEVAALMGAKLLLARAEHLENLIFLQRVSPASERDPADDEARAARFTGTFALRRVVDQYPDNKEARALLAEQESLLLSWITRKLVNEKKLSWDAFERFFTARGYDPKDRTGRWDGIAEVLQVYGLNPASTLMHYVKGTPDALADKAGAEQERAAADLVSLEVMRRLSRQGVLVKEMRGLDGATLKGHLNPTTADRKTALPDRRFHQMFLDLRETFSLDDLRTLADGNQDEFAKAFGKTIFDTFDPEMGWGEFGLNIVSGIGLVGRVIGATQYVVRGTATGVSKAWQVFRPKFGAGAAALAARPSVQALQAFGSRVLRPDLLAAALEDLAAFAKIAIAEDMEMGLALKYGSKWKFYARIVGGRAAAATLLAISGSIAADRYDVPALRVFVIAAFELGGTDMIADALAAWSSRTGRLVANLDRLEAEVVRQSDELIDHAARLDQVKKAITPRAGVTAGEAVSKVELPLAGAHTAQLAPAHGVDRTADYVFSLRSLAEAIRNKQYAEAGRILDGAVRPTLDRLKKSVDELKEKLPAVKGMLRGKPAQAGEIVMHSYGSMHVEVPTSFFRMTKEQYGTSVGRILLEGDRLLVAGKLDEAFECYLRAEKGMALHTDFALAGEVGERLSLRQHTRLAAARQAKARTADLDLPLQMRQGLDTGVSDLPLQGRLLPGGKAHSKYHELVHTTPSGAKIVYFFKALPRDVLEKEGRAEGVASAVGAKLGLPVVRLKVTRLTNGKDVAGNALSDGILSRYIVDRKEAVDLSLTELLAVKKDYGALRAFRLWMGDADAHLGNYVMGPDGRLYGIDFGKGTIDASRVSRMPRKGVTRPGNPDELLDRRLIGGTEKEYLEDCLDTFREWGDDKIALMKRSTAPKDLHLPAYYAWARQFEEFVSYADMADTVTKIKELCRNDRALREAVEQGYLQAGQDVGTLAVREEIEATMRTLKDRAEVLEEVLKKHFKKDPLPTTFRHPAPDRFRLDRFDREVTLAA